MTPHNPRKWRKLQNQIRTQRDPKQILDVLLTLDRILVEVSMRPYNLPQHERFSVPAQNRRLHAAVKQLLRSSSHQRYHRRNSPPSRASLLLLCTVTAPPIE